MGLLSLWRVHGLPCTAREAAVPADLGPAPARGQCSGAGARPRACPDAGCAVHLLLDVRAVREEQGHSPARAVPWSAHRGHRWKPKRRSEPAALPPAPSASSVAPYGAPLGGGPAAHRAAGPGRQWAWGHPLGCLATFAYGLSCCFSFGGLFSSAVAGERLAVGARPRGVGRSRAVLANPRPAGAEPELTSSTRALSSWTCSWA